jgi:peptidoglycan/xylan/chitin deacetylase (PgdA/CDA1 family)
MAAVHLLNPIPEKLACITLDFEQDYGWRVQQFNILKDNRREIEALGDLFRRLEIPLSLFITTHLLLDYPQTFDVIHHLGQDFHTHSHTHNMDAFDSRAEIAAMTATFQQIFGRLPLGYRAPLGVLRDGEVDLLAEYGLRFSSSVFPSLRPGQFNHLGMPAVPFMYENGIVELPLATVPRLRLIVALSYLKLLGWGMSRNLYRTFGLPQVLIFDSHLHDFIHNPTSFAKLPPQFRWAWGRNRGQGMAIFRDFIDMLRDQGYRFITMTELYEHIYLTPTRDKRVQAERGFQRDSPSPLERGTGGEVNKSHRLCAKARLFRVTR